MKIQKEAISNACTKRNETYSKQSCTGFKKNFKPDYYSFTGGVADFVYGGKEAGLFEYDDIGVILGQEIKKLVEQLNINTVKLGETIGATVVGAGSHTTEISGSTITYSSGIFPIKNIPILKLSSKDEESSLAELEDIMDHKLSWFNSQNEQENTALALTGKHNMDYQEISDLGRVISRVMNNKINILVQKTKMSYITLYFRFLL